MDSNLSNRDIFVGVGAMVWFFLSILYPQVLAIDFFLVMGMVVVALFVLFYWIVMPEIFTSRRPFRVFLISAGLIGLAFSLFMIIQHHRMRNHLDPVYQEFKSKVVFHNYSIEADDSLLRKRDEIARNAGFVRIGWWLAKGDRLFANAAVHDHAIYIWQPF